MEDCVLLSVFCFGYVLRFPFLFSFLLFNTLIDSRLLHKMRYVHFSPPKKLAKVNISLMFSLIRIRFDACDGTLNIFHNTYPPPPIRVFHKVFCRSEDAAEEQHSRRIMVLKYQKQQQQNGDFGRRSRTYKKKTTINQTKT